MCVEGQGGTHVIMWCRWNCRDGQMNCNVPSIPLMFSFFFTLFMFWRPSVQHRRKRAATSRRENNGKRLRTNGPTVEGQSVLCKWSTSRSPSFMEKSFYATFKMRNHRNGCTQEFRATLLLQRSFAHTRC